MENSQRTLEIRVITPILADPPGVAASDIPVIHADVTDRKGGGRRHLAYLDGIRGLSALYVVLFHYAIGRNGLPHPFDRLMHWMDYGRFAVDIFIVLSGYCLMLPVARAEDRRLRGGAGGYLRRRAKRILPPYFAAIALSIAVVWMGRHFRHGHASPIVPDPLALSPSNIVAHLLLIHNLSTRYVMSLNPVMWTVALEWQLYFVFPFLLLPLWRRLGITATVIVACLLGLVCLLLPSGYNLAWTCPWFTGLFAMGMAAAVLTESLAVGYRAIFLKTPWLLPAAFCCGALLPHSWLGSQRYWLDDILVGLAAACLILHCGRRLQERSEAPPAPLLRLFQSRAAVALGMFSYSLYLVHVPLGWGFLPLIRNLHLSDPALFLFNIGIKIPVICALAYGFYLVFERPFTSAGTRHPTKAFVP